MAIFCFRYSFILLLRACHHPLIKVKTLCRNINYHYIYGTLKICRMTPRNILSLLACTAAVALHSSCGHRQHTPTDIAVDPDTKVVFDWNSVTGTGTPEMALNCYADNSDTAVCIMGCIQSTYSPPGERFIQRYH